MENACLRVKFQPLYQKKTIDNSVCCLEIVPVVSCIQNLDKLVWRQDNNNYIEYSIPMTYKVVLRKWPAIQDESDHASVKTYHSCVDLLLTSSNSMIGCPGSGDISKIISDTFILKKCLENYDNDASKEYFARRFVDECKYSDNDMNLPNFNDTTNTLLQPEDIEKKKTETNTEDDKVEVITSNCQDFLDTDLYNESLDKIKNTENVHSVFGDIARRRNIVFTAKSYNNRESPPRVLTLSPICSVNTHETQLVNRTASKAVTCKIYESQRDLVLLGSISPDSELSDDYQVVSTMIDVKRKKSPKKIKQMHKIPREMRVVECIRYMESEILPLKMWLNDIKRQCTALGILFNKTPSKPSMMITTVSTSIGPEMMISGQNTNGIGPEMMISGQNTNSIGPEIMISGQNTKSNRAVYSIVFDG